MIRLSKIHMTFYWYRFLAKHLVLWLSSDLWKLAIRLWFPHKRGWTPRGENSNETYFRTLPECTWRFAFFLAFSWRFWFSSWLLDPAACLCLAMCSHRNRSLPTWQGIDRLRCHRCLKRFENQKALEKIPISDLLNLSPLVAMLELEFWLVLRKIIIIITTC